MNIKHRRTQAIWVICVVGILLAITALNGVQAADPSLWSAAATGGGQQSGGDYTLYGISGQPVVELNNSPNGGDYTAAGGLLANLATGYGGGDVLIYLPIVLKNYGN